MRQRFTSFFVLLFLAGCALHNPADLIQPQLPVVVMPAPYASVPEPFSKKGWEKAYARRNFRLGITLKDFLATPFPDDEEGHDGLRIPASNAYPVCFGDGHSPGIEYLELSSMYDDMAPGVLKCMFYVGTSYMQHPARLHIGHGWMIPTAFYFIQPGATGDYYLFKIASEQDGAALSPIRTALTQGLKQKPVWKEGYVLEASIGYLWETSTWRNGVSQIKLGYDSYLDKSKLTYTLDTLNVVAERRKKAAQTVKPGEI